MFFYYANIKYYKTNFFLIYRLSCFTHKISMIIDLYGEMKKINCSWSFMKLNSNIIYFHPYWRSSNCHRPLSLFSWKMGLETSSWELHRRTDQILWWTIDIMPILMAWCQMCKTVTLIKKWFSCANFLASLHAFFLWSCSQCKPFQPMISFQKHVDL